MSLLTIEDKDFIFASLRTIGFFLSHPKLIVKLNTYKYQGKGIKLGVGTTFIFDKAVSTKSHTQTFSCQSSVMTKGKNLPLTYSQATAVLESSDACGNPFSFTRRSANGERIA